jgi:hypothetical protein
VVDTVVVRVAAGRQVDVVTGDRRDISRLIEAAGASCEVIDV